MTYLTVKQVAARYNTTPNTIWRWARKSNFPNAVKLSSQCSRWRLADLEAWEATHGGTA